MTKIVAECPCGARIDLIVDDITPIDTVARKLNDFGWRHEPHAALTGQSPQVTNHLQTLDNRDSVQSPVLGSAQERRAVLTWG